MTTLKDRVDDALLEQALRSHLDALADDVHRSYLYVMVDGKTGKVVRSTLKPVIRGVAEIRRIEGILEVPEEDRWSHSGVERCLGKAAQ